MAHVIVLEDDQPCREEIRRSLESEGFDVTAVDGSNVEKVLRDVRPKCLVVSTTLDAGRDWAIDLVRSARSSDPEVGIVVVANGDIDLVEKETSGLDVWAVVEKPGEIDQLPSKVKLACEYANLPADAKAKLEGEIQMETMMFQRVKRETREMDRRNRPHQMGG